jgi:hypothetical protein
MDAPTWPTPPSLDTSLYHRPLTLHPAIDLHRGWCACRNREPWDPTETAPWREGWLLRLRVEWYGAATPWPWPLPLPTRTQDAQLESCVQQLRGILAELRQSSASVPHSGS